MERRDCVNRISWGRESTHRLGGFENRVEVGKIASSELGMKCLSIDDNLKCSTTRRHQAERFDILFQSQKFFRQTDGLGLVISNRAILDDNFQAHWLFTLTLSFDNPTDR
jgi:hypothetical protein